MHDLPILLLLLAQDEPSGALLFWGVVLGVAAVAIIALEVFVPSGGLLALGAGACIVASIVACFLYQPLAGFVALGIYCVLGPIAGVFAFRWWIQSPLARHFVLSSEVDRLRTTVGEVEGEPPARREDYHAMLRELIGAEGDALTPLHPVGTVRIEGERIEALAEGPPIPAGARIVVTDVYDNQIKVREVT